MTNRRQILCGGKPGTREKATAWQIAIGLQDVDGLKPSKYLITTIRKHIEGDITIDDVKFLLNNYYSSIGVMEEVELELERTSKSLTLKLQQNGYLVRKESRRDGYWDVLTDL